MNTATSEVSAPYAQALLSIAQSKDAVDEVSNIAGELLSLLKASDELSEL